MSNPSDAAMGLFGTAMGLAAVGIAGSFLLSMACQYSQCINCRNKQCGCRCHSKGKKKMPKSERHRWKNPYTDKWYNPFE